MVLRKSLFVSVVPLGRPTQITKPLLRFKVYPFPLACVNHVGRRAGGQSVSVVSPDDTSRQIAPAPPSVLTLMGSLRRLSDSK